MQWYLDWRFLRKCLDSSTGGALALVLAMLVNATRIRFGSTCFASLKCPKVNTVTSSGGFTCVNTTPIFFRKLSHDDVIVRPDAAADHLLEHLAAFPNVTVARDCSVVSHHEPK
jgi:hypothetical protein